MGAVPLVAATIPLVTATIALGLLLVLVLHGRRAVAAFGWRLAQEYLGRLAVVWALCPLAGVLVGLLVLGLPAAIVSGVGWGVDDALLAIGFVGGLSLGLVAGSILAKPLWGEFEAKAAAGAQPRRDRRTPGIGYWMAVVAFLSLWVWAWKRFESELLNMAILFAAMVMLSVHEHAQKAREHLGRARSRDYLLRAARVWALSLVISVPVCLTPFALMAWGLSRGIPRGSDTASWLLLIAGALLGLFLGGAIASERSNKLWKSCEEEVADESS